MKNKDQCFKKNHFFPDSYRLNSKLFNYNILVENECVNFFKIMNSK